MNTTNFLQILGLMFFNVIQVLTVACARIAATGCRVLIALTELSEHRRREREREINRERWLESQKERECCVSKIPAPGSRYLSPPPHTHTQTILGIHRSTHRQTQKHTDGQKHGHRQQMDGHTQTDTNMTEKHKDMLTQKHNLTKKYINGL